MTIRGNLTYNRYRVRRNTTEPGFVFEARNDQVSQAILIPGLAPNPKDPDARAYIAAVEQADDQRLETPIRTAIDNLFIGMKTAGLFAAIKQAYLFAGPRTLAGALVPMVGTAPTSTGFGAGDYNRLWGLKSDGTKWLDTNRADNIDLQNNHHNAVWLHTPQPAHVSGNYFGSGTDAGATSVGWSTMAQVVANRSRVELGSNFAGNVVNRGVWGVSREVSTDYSRRFGTAIADLDRTSQTPVSRNMFLFGRNGPSGIVTITRGRLRWYSAGDSLSLASLESVLSAYYQAVNSRLKMPTINVMLVGGQSNSEGRTTLASAPEYLTDQIPNVAMFHGTDFDNYYFGNPTRFGNGTYWSYSPSTARWGPFDVALAKIAEVVPNVVACRVSAGGSVLDSVASPTADRGSWSDRFGDIPSGTPALLQALENKVAALNALAAASGVVVNYIGMLWHQGEADFQKGGGSITNYESNWQDVVDDIRGFTRADLPIIYGTVPSVSTLYDATIRAAQLAVASGDSDLYCRDNDDLAMIGGGDTTHFNAAGNVTFGEWAAETFLDNYGPA